MQWNQSPCPFLRQDLRSVQNQEQTLELRLPEDMPDIGRVLCAWGQVMLRSKQWRSDSIQVSGGVSAQILYMPEEGGEPRSVACWLPVQGKWNLPETRREGTIRACGMLRSVDARLLSARKLMVRAGVGLLAEALEPAEGVTYQPPEMPEDVYFLEKAYPVTLPREAGEKLFLMDEELTLPQEARELISWELTPILLEQTVIGSRAVFKGEGRLHLVYMTQDGKLASCNLQVPFAQFAELDEDYDKEATVSAMLALSSLETELSGDRIHMKAGLICQYVVYDCRMLRVCEDAYSPFRALDLQLQEETFPVLLDRRSQQLTLQQRLQEPAQQVVDTVFYPEHPIEYWEGEEMVVELPGTFQLLGYDDQGSLCCQTETTTQRLSIPAGMGCMLCAERCEVLDAAGEAGQMTAQVQLELLASAKQPITMLSGVEIGGDVQPDPMRPAMILRRCEDTSLWELAKLCGSTVEAIQKANHLTADPIPGQMLLIPVC